MANLDLQYISQITSLAINGDSDAFAELYAATYQQQYRFAFNYLKDEYLSQDALQETYIKALKNIHTLSNPDLFISWLNQICFHVCFDIQKKQKRNLSELSTYEDDHMEDTASGSDVSLESQVIQIEETEYILRQVMSLPFTESQVILMKYYQDMTVDAIASLMDISHSSVKRYLKRGRERLHALIEM